MTRVQGELRTAVRIRLPRAATGRRVVVIRGGYRMLYFHDSDPRRGLRARSNAPFYARFQRPSWTGCATPDGSAQPTIRSVPTVIAGVNSAQRGYARQPQVDHSRLARRPVLRPEDQPTSRVHRLEPHAGKGGDGQHGGAGALRGQPRRQPGAVLLVTTTPPPITSGIVTTGKRPAHRRVCSAVAAAAFRSARSSARSRSTARRAGPTISGVASSKSNGANHGFAAFQIFYVIGNTFWGREQRSRTLRFGGRRERTSSCPARSRPTSKSGIDS